MLRKSSVMIVALTASAMVAGCSNIGTINGVRMNATTAPDATYCGQHPEVCILAGIAIVGGGIALIETRPHHHSTPAAAPPPPG